MGNMKVTLSVDFNADNARRIFAMAKDTTKKTFAEWTDEEVMLECIKYVTKPYGFNNWEKKE